MTPSTEEIPRESWSTYFEDLDRRLEAPAVTVEVDGEDIGAQRLAEGVRLAGISYDHKDDVVVIGFGGGSAEDHEHVISAPKRIFVAAGDDGPTAIDVEDAEGQKTIVRIEGSLNPGA